MAVWGSSFAILRSLLGNAAASPLSLVAVRMALASALLLGGMAATRSGRTQLRGLRGELLRDGLVAGGLLGLGFLLQTEGLQRTTASRSGFLTGTLVVFTPLIEFVLFRKRPAPPALAGVLLAFVGITVLSAPWSGAARPTALGDALTLGCAVVFAGQIVALGRIARKHPVLPLLLVQLATTGAVAAIAGPLVETQHFSGAPRLWLALLYLAVFATLLAFGVQTWAQRILPPVRVALISSLEPVFAAIWAAILIGERLSLRELVGGAMIVLGVAVGEAGAALRARARGERPARARSRALSGAQGAPAAGDSRPCPRGAGGLAGADGGDRHDHQADRGSAPARASAQRRLARRIRAGLRARFAAADLPPGWPRPGQRAGPLPGGGAGPGVRRRHRRDGPKGLAHRRSAGAALLRDAGHPRPLRPPALRVPAPAGAAGAGQRLRRAHSAGRPDAGAGGRRPRHGPGAGPDPRRAPHPAAPPHGLPRNPGLRRTGCRAEWIRPARLRRRRDRRPSHRPPLPTGSRPAPCLRPFGQGAGRPAKHTGGTAALRSRGLRRSGRVRPCLRRKARLHHRRPRRGSCSRSTANRHRGPRHPRASPAHSPRRLNEHQHESRAPKPARARTQAELYLPFSSTTRPSRTSLPRCASRLRSASGYISGFTSGYAPGTSSAGVAGLRACRSESITRRSRSSLCARYSSSFAIPPGTTGPCAG